MDPKERRSRATEGFFGRRHGKTIRPQQAAALESGLCAYGLDLSAHAPADLRTLFAADVSTVRLEIGFGGGEHLLHRATEAPATGFIGVEPFVNGMAKALAAIDDAKLTNIRLHHADAVELLDWLPAASIGRIDLLYPDPWPKRRHWKRRFVNDDNIARLAHVLKVGAELRFATDWANYAEWTLARMMRAYDFTWTAERADDWRKPWGDFTQTRYEAKAIREGRVPCYLIFRRP